MHMAITKIQEMLHSPQNIFFGGMIFQLMTELIL